MNELPAILGGRQAVSVPHKPYPPIGDGEKLNVMSVLESGRLWAPWGRYTRELESAWSSYVGVRYCSALNSGTAALHCCLVGVGVVPGDEVIVPAWTFAATAAAVRMCGASPVFVDVDPEAGNISPAAVFDAVTEKTRAVVCVHLHGVPADLLRIQTICRDLKLKLVEDCAQAHGAKYRGSYVGTFGDASAFSLNATKNLVGPEGGFFCTNSTEVFNRAASARVFGALETDEGRKYSADPGMCFNYRPNELCSAFALARLSKLESENYTRSCNVAIINGSLEKLQGLCSSSICEHDEVVWQMFRIRLNPGTLQIPWAARSFRALVLRCFAAEGMEWFVWQEHMVPELNAFRTCRCHDVSEARKVADDSIYTCAHFPPNGTELMEQYASAIRKVWLSLPRIIQELGEPSENVPSRFQEEFQ